MPLRRGWLSVLVILAFSVAARSQSVTGSIRGTATDTNGQPLPGVTVIVRSISLIGQRETITNEQGAFRFPLLPVGLYSLEARLHGFDKSITNKVDISVGGTTEVPLRMRVSKAESITVEGTTPLLDPQNSGSSTVYKEEMVQKLPTQRNMWVLMQVAPGITTDLGDFRNANSTIAFGSNRQSNSWHIDGIDASGPETGMPWMETNPDIIDQIQIYGVGAPAEYGNHSGAVFNVVTKSGGNDLHGSLTSFFQTQKLTDVNVRLPDSDFVFHRDKFYDISAQAGGPIKKDKIWFFGSVETWRDGSTPTGVDPKLVPLVSSDKYDLKINARLGQRLDLNASFHDESQDNPDLPSPYIAHSATGHEFLTNPAWSATVTSTANERLMLEFNYAGWYSHDRYASQTGSLEEPVLDFRVYPTVYSGGLSYPFDYWTYRHQANTKITYYADDFLKSQHEFKFGAQYSYGSGTTLYGIGPNGSYSFFYYWGAYQYIQAPFFYGAVSKSLGIYVDDSAELSKRLTLNLGLRFDRSIGSIPDYDRLEVGTPSITSVGNFRRTGEKIPGVDGYVRWNLLSPRLGFVWRTREDGRAALRGSFGVYYENDVFGNWDAPPPDEPVNYIQLLDQQGNPVSPVFPNGQYTVPRDDHLKPPRSLQYSLGYQFQTTQNSSFDVLYVHKDTDNLIGWQILGGQWYIGGGNSILIDPFTGRQYPVLFTSSPPMIQKGNDPGDFPGGESLRYFQNYNGLVFTFTQRFSNDWALNASYTWSRSYGLIPRMLSQNQFQPFYGNHNEGNNPNNFINATGRLQGDRPHMFRTQVVCSRLPWNLHAASSIEFSSGRPYTRQIRVHGEECCFFTRMLMEPPGSRRHSPIQNIDLSIGKWIPIGNRYQVNVEGQIFNLLNSDQELLFASLILMDTSQTFIPSAWVQPRRLQLRIGLQF